MYITVSYCIYFGNLQKCFAPSSEKGRQGWDIEIQFSTDYIYI